MIGLLIVAGFLVIVALTAIAIWQHHRTEQDHARARAALRPGHDPGLTPTARQHQIDQLYAMFRAPNAKHRFARREDQ